MRDFAAALVRRGLGDDAAATKARLCEGAWEAAGLEAGAEGFAAFVPGRIEVLGKHTDYAGGRSLLCAAERGVCLAARPRDDALVRVTDVVSGDRADAVLDPSPVRVAGGLPLYVATVTRRLARNFPGARRGADIAFGSDLPMAAGMSSSSALVTAVLLALVAVNHLDQTAQYRANIGSREDLAEFLGTIENGQDFHALKGDTGVGTFGGSEDHTAMLCSRARELSQYSFCPVRHERQIPLSPEYSFAVAVSGVVAEKTGSARETYNRASLAARTILSLWNGATGRQDATLRAAVESSVDATDRIRAVLAATQPSLRARFDQFVEETFEIIPAVGDRLVAGRVEEISDLVQRSQAAAERGLRNQVPETTFLAHTAGEIGAAAASAFGAGFGGGVWALARTTEMARFCAEWRKRYVASFPQHASHCQFFATRPGPAAVLL